MTPHQNSTDMLRAALLAEEQRRQALQAGDWQTLSALLSCSSLIGSIPMPIIRLDRSLWDLDKYLMRTYKASVRVKVNDRSQVIATEIRAPSVQDARWLLWAIYGFHSILTGPSLVNTHWAA